MPHLTATTLSATRKMSQTPGWTTNLEDGLVMRGAVPDDVDRLSDYNAEMHHEPGSDEPAFYIGEWTRDLFTKPHPRMRLDDIIIVENPSSGEIVSSCVYFDHTWSYCGIPVSVGRPEIVSTHPDYRNRGLIRKQFDLMHRWGDERGHLVQGITGIPYYYRQFGYEMALEMATSRQASVNDAPKWKNSEEPTVRLRAAVRSDVPLINRLRGATKQRALFTPDMTEADLDYQLFGRSDRSAVSMSTAIIESADNIPVGFMVHKTISFLEQAQILAIEFADPGMIRTQTKPVMKAFQALVSEPPKGEQKPIKRIYVELPATHPAQPFIGRSFTGSLRPYAWYVRTPDLPKLLMLIAPILEQRLVGTSFEGLTDDMLLGFYRTGVRLTFDAGRLTAATLEKMPDRQLTAVNMPDLTFMQILFGRRSFSEIAGMFIDASAKTDADAALIDTLFPKMASDMMFALS